MRAPQDAVRAVAGLSWTLLLFAMLYLVAAAAPDSGMFWDVERQSRTAWTGIGLLVTALPVGVVALVLDRPNHGRVHAPGESCPGLRHPLLLTVALASAAVIASFLAVVVARVF